MVFNWVGGAGSDDSDRIGKVVIMADFVSLARISAVLCIILTVSLPVRSACAVMSLK